MTAVPDTSAYLWTLGLVLLFGGLMACAGIAWPKVRSRWLDWALGIDKPGDVLTAVPADTVLPLRTAMDDCKGAWNQPCQAGPDECGYHQPPRARRLHREQVDAFAAIARSNPDLADVAALSALYLIPSTEEQP